MFLTKSKIYETRLLSSLIFIPVNLKNFDIEDISNWKRKRIFNVIHTFGSYKKNQYNRLSTQNYVVSTQKPHLLEYYGKNTIGDCITYVIQGRRHDLIDSYLRPRQWSSFDINWSMTASVEYKFYEIFHYFLAYEWDYAREKLHNSGCCIEKAIENGDKKFLKYLIKIAPQKGKMYYKGLRYLEDPVNYFKKRDFFDDYFDHDSD